MAGPAESACPVGACIKGCSWVYDGIVIMKNKTVPILPKLSRIDIIILRMEKTKEWGI